MKWIKYALFAALVTTVASVLHYTLPQVDVVRIIGTDVKRVDAPQDAGETNADTGMRTADVYFILAETDGGSVRNYRNEDALIYGKFDSSDLHTRARSISQNEENTVAIRHYGWRLPLFSVFPNATSVWEVEPGYRHLPLFNIVFLTLLAGGLGYTAWRVRKIRIRIAEARAEREAEAAAEAERKARERDLTDSGSMAEEDRNKALEDFFGSNDSASGGASGGNSGGGGD